MNYLDYINSFWKQQRNEQMTANDWFVYSYLLNEANKISWSGSFRVSTNIACVELQMSRQTFTKVRNKLKQKNLIDFIEGTRNAKAQYTINDVSKNLTSDVKNLDVSIDTSVDTSIDTSVDTSIDTSVLHVNNACARVAGNIDIDNNNYYYSTQDVFADAVAVAVVSDVNQKYGYAEDFKARLLSGAYQSWLEILGMQLKIPANAFESAVDDFII